MNTRNPSSTGGVVPPVALSPMRDGLANSSSTSSPVKPSLAELLDANLRGAVGACGLNATCSTSSAQQAPLSSDLVLIRMKHVIARTRLSRGAITRRIQSGDFPAPISLGEKALGFLESEIDRWLLEQIRASRPLQFSALRSNGCEAAKAYLQLLTESGNHNPLLWAWLKKYLAPWHVQDDVFFAGFFAHIEDVLATQAHRQQASIASTKKKVSAPRRAKEAS